MGIQASRNLGIVAATAVGIAAVDIAAKTLTRHVAKNDGDFLLRGTSVAIMRGDDTGADVSMTGFPRSPVISAVAGALGITIGVGIGVFTGNKLAAIGGGLVAGAIVSNHGESLTHHGTISNYLGYGNFNDTYNVVNLADVAVTAGTLLAISGLVIRLVHGKT